MGTSVGVIYYEVEAKTARLLESIKPAEESVDKLGKSLSKTDKAANEASFTMTKTAAAVKGLGRESEVAASSLGGLTKLLGGILTLQGASALVQMGEGYREMGERIRFATSSQEEYEEVQRRLLSTANGTYRALSEAQEVYILTADSLRSIGYSTSQAVDITDSLSYAFVKNAASGQRATSATNAYAKSIQVGRVNVESWQSILAAIPSIIGDIAAASELSAEEVRRLGAEGKLSIEQLNEGLRKSLNSNKSAADGMATTVKDAFTAMQNSLSMYLGESQNATHATGLLSSSIVMLSKNIDTVVSLLVAAGSGALASYIAKTGEAALASGKAMLAARGQAIEELKLAQAHVTATAAALKQAQANSALSGMSVGAAKAADAHSAALSRLAVAQAGVTSAGRVLLGVLGGPAGIVGLAAAAGVALLTMGGKAEASKPKVDLLTEALHDLGDAQLRVLRTGLIDKITEMESLEGVAQKAGARIEFLNRQLSSHPSSKEAESWRREIDNQEASIEAANKSLRDYREQMRLVNEEQGKRRSTSKERPQEADPEVQKRLQALRDELELAKLTGEARARLQAIQRLGANASEKEREEAERLAAQIYQLEQSHKKTTEAKKADTKESEANAKVLADMAQELGLAALKGEELAVAKAKLRLNDAVTPGEAQAAEALAKALHRVAQEEENRQLLKQHDPIANENFRFQEQLDSLRRLNEAKLLEDQRYIDLKSQAETAHAEKMRALHEENFRAQSQWNETMMASIDAIGSSGTSALSGLLVGMHSGTDAARMLGNAVLNEVVGSFVKMGIAQVKAWVMGQAAQSAAAAGYVASVAGQVAANTALAAQAAFASTAAIPIIGPAMAPAAAAAAGGMAASLGAPAIAGASASLAGGRQYGGPVSAGKMYRINENGAPEVYNAANGQQFLLPNSRGKVVSNKDATSGGGGAAPKVTVNIHNAPEGTRVEQQQIDRELIIDVMVQDVATEGRFTQAGASMLGWRRQGR